MDKKIIQKLEEIAKKIKFGSYKVEFIIHQGKIVKIKISDTREVVIFKLDN